MGLLLLLLKDTSSRPLDPPAADRNFLFSSGEAALHKIAKGFYNLIWFDLMCLSIFS
jgi:hypothetical protein